MSAPRIFTPEYYARMRTLEASGWWNAGMRDAAGMLLQHAGLPPRGTLLDVGCGSGQTMTWFTTSHPGWQTIGLDVALEGLRAARAGAGAPVTQASALAIPYPDATFDLAISLDVR